MAKRLCLLEEEADGEEEEESIGSRLGVKRVNRWSNRTVSEEVGRERGVMINEGVRRDDEGRREVLSECNKLEMQSQKGQKQEMREEVLR